MSRSEVIEEDSVSSQGRESLSSQGSAGAFHGGLGGAANEGRFPVPPPRRRQLGSSSLLRGKGADKGVYYESDRQNGGGAGGCHSCTEPEGESEPQLYLGKSDKRMYLAASGPLGLQKARRTPLVVPGGLDVSMSQRLKKEFFGFVWWCGQLERQYGRQLLLLLFSSQHLLRGVVMRWQGAAVMWVLMEYRVDGPQMQIFMSIANSSWAFKPIIGAISDMFPIFGFRKAPYVIITSILGVACTSYIGLSTIENTSVFVIVACLFGATLQISTCDLLTEAKYSEQLQENPAYGPDLITFVWGGVSVGNMIAIAIVGWIISELGPRAVFLSCAVPAAMILVPTLANYFGERPLTREATVHLREAFLQQREVVFLCVLMTCLTVFLTAVGGLTESHVIHVSAALFVLMILLPSFYIVLRPEIAKINTFFVLQAALSLNIGGATFYFYTDKQDQYPDGPHFSPSFFASTLGMVASLMSIVGLVLYTRYMKDWSYRTLIMFSNVLATFLSLLDLAIFLRANRRIGIPDSIFVLGSSAFSVVIKQWQWMPGVVILSQLCPIGMEATMFALLAGCANVGNQVADYLGAGLLASLDVQPSGAVGEGAQFLNLWKASCVATLLPAVTIALIPTLIPHAKQTERLLLNDVSSATAGSLLSVWRRWQQERHGSQ